MTKKKVLFVTIVLGGMLAALQLDFFVMVKEEMIHQLSHRYTTKERIGQYGEIVQKRMVPFFERKGIRWPAQKITLVGLKEERRLEVWIEDGQRNLQLVRSYPILGASGTSGPKLREGDGQVPEGIYAIESLNPNSAFHLSLRINYPNAFDLKQAKDDGREHLGGDIMIHGKTSSAGCLAMGDEAIEDLFVMTALTPSSNIKIILAPFDLRIKEPFFQDNIPWVTLLYRAIRSEMPTPDML